MSQLGRADSLSSVVTPGSFTGILRSQNCASPWLRGRFRSTPPEMDRSNQWLSRERESKAERSSESHIFHPQAADAAVRNMLSNATSGCDYLPRLRGVGPALAVQVVVSAQGCEAEAVARATWLWRSDPLQICFPRPSQQLALVM